MYIYIYINIYIYFFTASSPLHSATCKAQYGAHTCGCPLNISMQFCIGEISHDELDIFRTGISYKLCRFRKAL